MPRTTSRTQPSIPIRFPYLPSNRTFPISVMFVTRWIRLKVWFRKIRSVKRQSENTNRNRKDVIR